MAHIAAQKRITAQPILEYAFQRRRRFRRRTARQESSRGGIGRGKLKTLFDPVLPANDELKLFTATGAVLPAAWLVHRPTSRAAPPVYGRQAQRALAPGAA